jgi:hypothetical protein
MGLQLWFRANCWCFNTFFYGVTSDLECKLSCALLDWPKRLRIFCSYIYSAMRGETQYQTSNTSSAPPCNRFCPVLRKALCAIVKGSTMAKSIRKMLDCKWSGQPSRNSESCSRCVLGVIGMQIGIGESPREARAKIFLQDRDKNKSLGHFQMRFLQCRASAFL